MTAAPPGGQDARALFERAHEAHEAGRLPEAEKLYRAALEVQADFLEALLGLGVLLQKAQRLPESRQLLERFTGLEPELAYAWDVLGQVRTGLDDLESAVQAFAKAVEVEPEYIPAHVNLGLTFSRLGRTEAALHAMGTALVIAPDDAEALKHYALVALDAARPDDAVRAAERAREAGLAPAQAARLLGLAHLCGQQYARAEPEFRRALQAMPDSPEVVASLGVALEGAGRVPEAIEVHRAYLERHPGDLHVRFMLALLLLGRGEFAEGWQFYMARPSAQDPRSILAPALDVRDLAGKRVLVHSEQGIGDEVLFLRYLPELRRVAGPAGIAYAASPKLKDILSRASEVDEVLPQEAPRWLGPRLLLGDLPFLCRSTEGAVPPPLHIPALPERVAKWREALAAGGPGPYLAVNWQGGQMQERPGQAQWFGRLQVRCIAPGLLGAALRGWPGTVVCLQWMQEAADREAFGNAYGGRIFDSAQAHDDVEDLLALLETVDELVGVSSTNVHLRAAARKPARVLVQQPAEWRWMQEGERSPWYPGFTLYRQGLDLDWSGALARLRRDLGL